jgi:hypothetical protein
MSQQRIQQFLPELKRLDRLSVKEKKKYIKTCDKQFIKCICECVKNLLKGNVPIKSSQLKSLARYKQSLRKLAVKKTSLAKRRQLLQKAGFVGLLIKPLLRGLGYILGNL